MMPEALRDRCQFESATLAQQPSPTISGYINRYFLQESSIEITTRQTVGFIHILALDVHGLYDDIASAVCRLQDKD